ncbi:MAG: valine--tRNA ligase [Myxococcales bacterium]|nr:valine--tRNA ligase [Myxococcales bacterium]
MSEARAQIADLDKGYEPAKVEPYWGKWWEEQGFFKSQDVSEKPPFSVVQPPPNVTGSLHLGHALTATMEDVLARWKRMSGFNVCWLPGIDHAGIATQMVVERELSKKEYKSRHDLGREEFLKRVWAWKEAQGDRIAVQHRALGASLDWDRLRFTMDEQSSRAVREAFVRLYDDGLLYRAERLINWCVKDGTALSDLEVDHEEGVKSELYRFAYPLADGSGEIVVATTRVETMLGDTAVAVHPDDPRYQSMIGKNVRHPILGREFPIIADAELVDPKFGTGAVKVTPGHSFEDFETGKRHDLPLINILNLDGTLNDNAGPFKGIDRIKVRDALKAKLAELGLERGTEAHTMALGKCQRCGNIVEPLLSKQWFVKTRPLAEKVIAHVDDMRFVPSSWRAEFLRWMTNIHDWTVSRQLWWGHQIPAWYCAHGHVNVARETPGKCRDCEMTDLRQDPDVLDTWFSSGLWPFSTLGWPDETPALKTFYPNSVMETGFDILFFWVARMAMLGLHFMGEVPFRTVFLHAMVRDEKGEKMSKTRGNVIDPLDITQKHGADALRFTLASMAGQGRDIKLSVSRIEGYRAFANKIWNAARFVLMNSEGYDSKAGPASVYDRWILSRFQRCADETRGALGEFRLSDAANGIYRFIWNELCDWAIELSKPALYGEKTPAERAGAQAALLTALDGALRLLHPFMPFVTEEIWQRLPNRTGPSIMIAPYPEARKDLLDRDAEREMDVVIRAIDGARSVRGEVNLPPNQRISILVVPRDEKARALFERHLQAFKLANAAVDILPLKTRLVKTAVHVEPEAEIHLPMEGLIDFAAEKARVEKEIGAIDSELKKIQDRLGNPGFVARAPKEVVEKDRLRAEELGGKREKLARHLARVTSVEDGMEDKNPQHPGHDRSLDQMGTHGGPASGSQPPAQQPQPKSDEQAAAAPVQASDEDEAKGLAAKAMSHVKSIARGLMEKAEEKVRGPVSEETVNEERAEIAQAQASAEAEPTSPAMKARKERPGTKHVRGGKNKADKAGKVGKGRKAGRMAAARGAKKGTRGAGGKRKNQKKRPMKTQSRANVRGGPMGKSRGGGRGAQKGARGKSGAKRRPSPRKGTK